MPSVIQVRRAGTTTPVVIPTTVGANGEPFYARGGFSNLPVHVVATNDLIISDGTAFQVLVGATRQVELAGAQTISGRKTISMANLSIPGGVAGDVIVTDGAGNLSWGAGGGTGGISQVETDNITIQGNGLPGDEVSLVTGIFTATANSGLAYAAGSVTVNIATQAVFGGSFISTPLQIGTGTNDASIITPMGLRSQLGADVTTLTTTVKTIVPAINELAAAVTATSGVMRLAGAYDAATNAVIPGSGGEIPAGPLPAASAANNGFYVIVSVAGTGTGNAPPVALGIGDWLASNGTAWVHIGLAQGSATADGIAMNPTVNGWTDVQAAIEGLYALPVVVDNTSITGTGVTGDPLTVALVDGGVF
jgi:hypothetical protein